LLSLLGGGIGHLGMFGQGKMGPFSGAAGGHNRRGFGETIGPSHTWDLWVRYLLGRTGLGSTKIDMKYTFNTKAKL